MISESLLTDEGEFEDEVEVSEVGEDGDNDGEELMFFSFAVVSI
jgi:hypothetical protein